METISAIKAKDLFEKMDDKSSRTEKIVSRKCFLIHILAFFLQNDACWANWTVYFASHLLNLKQQNILF